MSKQLTISEAIERTQERFSKVAPPSIRFEAEKGFAIGLINNNSYLRKAAEENPGSLMQAIASIAAIGLSLNPAEKQAYLITRNVKVAQNKWETRVFLEPSYQGLCKLATDSGSIEWVQAKCVYANDEFTDNGPGEKPTHKYSAFAKPDQRGEFIGVYCLAKTSGGDYLTTTMPSDQVYSIRDRSEAWKAKVAGKTKHGGPWESDFEEMAKKTVVRNAFKMWPRSNLSRMAEAVHISNENEGFEPILTTPQIGQYTALQKDYFDKLIESSDAMGMHVFQQTLNDDSMFTNLYHSFEKGQKGKFQRIVDDLMLKGKSQAMDYANAILERVQAGDDLGTVELISELSQDAFELIAKDFDAEVLAQIGDWKQQSEVSE